MENIFDSGTFSLIILPILIFFSPYRRCYLRDHQDNIRFKGLKWLAPVFGFFEIMIWLFAIGQVFSNLTNISYYVAYAGGFACGNFVGILIEEKMAIGTLIVRIITRNDGLQLIEMLRSQNFGVTSFDAQGSTGKVKIIYSIIKRRDLPRIVEIIKTFNPRAFYSIEEVRSASEGIFPPHKQRSMSDFPVFSGL